MAFCLDEAVAYFGNTLKGELEGVKGKTDREIENKQHRIIRRVFGDHMPQRKFQDPALHFTKGGDEPSLPTI